MDGFSLLPFGFEENLQQSVDVHDVKNGQTRQIKGR